MRRTTTRRGHLVSIAMLAGGAASFLVAGVLAAAPATAKSGGSSAAPPGANATIKINNLPFDAGNANEPHVTCPFQLSFYNFDSGKGVANTAKVAFEAQPPSGHFVPLAPSDGASSFTFPGPNFADTYSFSSTTLAPLYLQPQQGYHVKVGVTVTSTGIKVNGKPAHSKVTKKSKVFWLTCKTPSPSPTATPTNSQSPTPTVSPTQTTSVLPTETSRTASPGTTVLPTKAVRPPGNLPMTGLAATGLKVLLPAALGFILSGCGLVGLTRKITKGSHL